MEEKTPKKGVLIGLIVITLIGLGLHLYRISYFDRPVYDEVHFATYAADYTKDKVFSDIHPPLGKLIYASIIPLAHPGPLGDTDFLSFIKNSTGTVYSTANIPFGSFPYVPLRLVGILFGLFLAVIFYFFLRNIGVSEVGALLGAFFVTFENALLLDTKFILMNGMYLAFGFAALAVFFRKSPLPVAAGFLFGLSLGVKLIGIVFAGPVIIEYLISKWNRSHPAIPAKGPGESEALVSVSAGMIRKFFTTATLVFIAISLLNFLFFSSKDILSFAKSTGEQVPTVHNARGAALFAYIATTVIPLTGYIIGAPQPQESPWYLWPFMHGSIAYYTTPLGVGNLILKGNPVIWYGSTIAMIIGVIIIMRRSYRLIRANEPMRDEYRAPLLLIAGYLFSLLPFFTFVRRSTFLYHYFPALLFAIGFLAWGLSRWLKLETFNSLIKRQWLCLAGIAALTIGGFIITAPFTYGL